MVGFAIGLPGIVGAICGLLACVASSIIICCGPRSVEEGSGKFSAVRKSAHGTAKATTRLDTHPWYDLNTLTPGQLPACTPFTTLSDSHDSPLPPPPFRSSPAPPRPRPPRKHAGLSPPPLPYPFPQASVLLFIAGIIQLIMGIVVIVWMIQALNEVHILHPCTHAHMCRCSRPRAQSHHVTPCAHTTQVSDDNGNGCKDRYSNCDVDSSGTRCKGGYGSIFEGFEGYNDRYKDGVCYKDHPDHITKRLTPPSPPRAAPRGPPLPLSSTLPTYIQRPPPASFPRRSPPISRRPIFYNTQLRDQKLLERLQGHSRWRQRRRLGARRPATLPYTTQHLRTRYNPPASYNPSPATTPSPHTQAHSTPPHSSTPPASTRARSQAVPPSTDEAPRPPAPG